MIRLPRVVGIRVGSVEQGDGWLAVRCLGGRAKWTDESRVLSVKADIVNEETHDQWLDFFASMPVSFRMEVDYQTDDSLDAFRTSSFTECREAVLELRSATARPNGVATTRYFLKVIAEPGASGNHRPASRH
jgi:hypothetical protein